MDKRLLAVLATGVLAVGGGAAALALVGSEAQPVHEMSNGQMHTGTMPTDAHTMGNGSSMDRDALSDLHDGK